MFLQIDLATYYEVSLKRLGKGPPGRPPNINPPSKAGDVGLISACGTKVPHATE